MCYEEIIFWIETFLDYEVILYERIINSEDTEKDVKARTNIILKDIALLKSHVKNKSFETFVSLILNEKETKTKSKKGK